ncbi:NADH-cytochrome b5 reductase-like [Rhinophrynus dorsalis]
MCDQNVDWLSLRPVEPSPAQCCGSGCSPCIYDMYQAKLALWEEAKERGDPRLLNSKGIKTSTLLLSPDTFTSFTLCSVTQEAEDTNRYRFRLPTGCTLGLQLGQHLVLRGTVDDLEIQRAYTPISPVNSDGYFEVLIKIYEHGLMSRYITCWREGDLISWRGPFGGFAYKPNQYGELVMLCSGTGLAPMVPILRYITDNEEDETFITLVACFRTFERVYMKSFLQEQARFWNLRTFYVLSQETSLETLPWSYRENTKIGRIDSTFMARILDTCRREPHLLICGSLSFNKDMADLLKQLGHRDNSIFTF